ncbi:lytic polysaccharide monooxygenase auxiliary activity family 9 protein [Actinomadura sp. 9N215]|uniref:lytic polysaccharide monooxygenase auxiliary activity family 9 protein n=1 Tax=Actinomadura sp. 9N215 TaxID=3375150 RepID=UPI0037AAB4B0
MKSARRKVAAVAAGVGIAPLITVVLPATSAYAHGYVSSPSSRQAQCAQRIVQCGQIQWEPQSVEGPKGLQSCSGGNARFSDLDDDSKPWRPSTVGNTVTFNWTFTARHSTRDYEYFINGKSLGKYDARASSHTVNLGRVTGRQKVLAVWNIADTGNAFYACVDLQVQ